MQNKKRAIILDMDETLESAVYGDNNDKMMVLRPNLDELISKLQEAKNQEIDIILCTTAGKEWIERLLTLKPEMKTIFDKMLTGDNEEEWTNYSEENYPLEYALYFGKNGKPVTTFGYDSILFIDDNSAEEYKLEELFEKSDGKLEKDVTYFSGFGFKGGNLPLRRILGYKKAATQSPELAQKLEEYLETEKSNPGCHMMCSVIDNFINKEFTPVLTLVDVQYSEEYELYYQKLRSLRKELKKIEDDLSKQTGEKIIKHTDSENEEIQAYLNTDRRYPYEGIEIEKTKKEKLGELIQTAIDTQAKLDEAEKLKESYEQRQPKEEPLNNSGDER